MSELNEKLQEIKRQKDTYILPENLKKDITVYGVTGTYEGSGGSGDVKLFKTKEEMNSSTGNVEGDLALVYKNEQHNMTADMEVTAITFPETVTLPTAFTGNAYGRLEAVDSSVMFDGNCNLSETSFSFESRHGWSRSIYASYTSKDGITYTRTRLQGDNPVKLPTTVKGNANEWNDNFGYFMQISASVFEGIYVYKNNSWKLAPTQLTATPGDVYKQLFYGKNGVESGTLGTPDNSFADTNAKVYNEIQNQYDNMEPRILTDDDKTIDKNIYFIPAKRDGTPLLDTSNVTKMITMFANCKNLTTIPELNTSKVTDMSSMFYGCTNLTTIPELNTSKVTDMPSMFSNCSSLTTIPLLDTSSAIRMDSMFDGCSNLTTIPELNTSNVTNMISMFNGCSNLTTIPELNTSNVTNMAYMFNGCKNLTTIPQLDTSNATNMQGMFEGCSSLTTIPQLNTSNVTSMTEMFYKCSKLITIPLLDTSSIVAGSTLSPNMSSIFSGCSSLSDDSLNNIMQMCINATSYTGTKTLQYIGLSSEQADKCKTLSNYSAFTSAGWTTGY